MRTRETCPDLPIIVLGSVTVAMAFLEIVGRADIPMAWNRFASNEITRRIPRPVLTFHREVLLTPWEWKWCWCSSLDLSLRRLSDSYSLLILKQYCLEFWGKPWTNIKKWVLSSKFRANAKDGRCGEETRIPQLKDKCLIFWHKTIYLANRKLFVKF